LRGTGGYWRAPLYRMETPLGLTLVAIFAIVNLAGADSGRPNLIFLGVFVLAATVWCQMALKRQVWTP
jgi:hypothetical protein